MGYAVTIKYQDHEERTKFYQMALIQNTVKGKSLLIKRWGKLGTKGQVIVEEYDSCVAGAREMEKVVRHRKGRKYLEAVETNPSVTDWASVLRVLPSGMVEELTDGFTKFITSPEKFSATTLESVLNDLDGGEQPSYGARGKEKSLYELNKDRYGDEWGSW